MSLKIKLKSIFTDIRLVFVMIMIGVSLVSYSYVTVDNLVTPLWPLNGIALGIYLGFGRKNLAYIFLGSFVGSLISSVLYLDNSFITLCLSSLTLSTVLIGEILLFIYLMDKTKSFGYIAVSNFLSYVIIIVLVSIISSLITSVFLSQLFTEYTFFNFLLPVWIGAVLSYLIFGTGVLLSFYNKEAFISKPKDLVLLAVTTILFTITCFILLQSYDSTLNLRHYSYIYVIFYVFLGFKFNTRIAILFNLIFTLFFQINYNHTIPSNLLVQETTEVIVILFLLTYTTYLIQITLNFTKKQTINLETSLKQQESLLSSTIDLFHLSANPFDVTNITVEDYFKNMFAIAVKVFKKFDVASCYLKQEQYVYFVDAIGYNVRKLNSYKFDVNKFIWNLDKPKIIYNADQSVAESLDTQYDKFVQENLRLKESIRFTIFVKEEIVGGMSFDIEQGSEKTFSKKDLENYTAFQNTMNSFFSHAMITKRNERLLNNVVLGLVSSLELYDYYTSGHSEDVAKISQMIASKLNLPTKQVKEIYLAGITHDIGKIGVEQSIINKPSKLNEEEYEQVKLHSIYGYNLLNRSKELTQVAKAVKYHHEWWNGKGYPEGLKEDEIPIESQIISCADAISSMATKRPYSKIKPFSKIREEIIKYSGTQFSPKIASIVVQLIDEGAFEKHYENWTD